MADKLKPLSAEELREWKSRLTYEDCYLTKDACLRLIQTIDDQRAVFADLINGSPKSSALKKKVSGLMGCVWVEAAISEDLWSRLLAAAEGKWTE